MEPHSINQAQKCADKMEMETIERKNAKCKSGTRHKNERYSRKDLFKIDIDKE